MQDLEHWKKDYKNISNSQILTKTKNYAKKFVFGVYYSNYDKCNKE